jgi:hypothetical protein
MKPTDVNDSMFPIHKVLYKDEFSIVWGTWRQSGKKGLGMRWDELPKEPGFPTGFNNCPRWLVIPTDLSLPFVTALLSSEFADKSAVLEVLQELLNQPTKGATSATA